MSLVQIDLVQKMKYILECLCVPRGFSCLLILMAKAAGTQSPKLYVASDAFLIYANECLFTKCVPVHQQHTSLSCCVPLPQLRAVSLRPKHTKVSKAFLCVDVLQS